MFAGWMGPWMWPEHCRRELFLRWSGFHWGPEFLGVTPALPLMGSQSLAGQSCPLPPVSAFIDFHNRTQRCGVHLGGVTLPSCHPHPSFPTTLRWAFGGEAVRTVVWDFKNCFENLTPMIPTGSQIRDAVPWSVREGPRGRVKAQAAGLQPPFVEQV